MLRRFTSVLSVLLCACLALVSCKNDDPKGGEGGNTDLKLSPTSLTMMVDEMQVISYSGNSGTVTWESSDTAVCSVTSGVVIAKAIGKSIVTAADQKGKVSCTVYVTGSDGSSLRLTPGQVNLEKGESYQLKCGNTYGLPVTWSSSDETVATVDQNGLVKALKPGNSFITLSTGAEEKQCLVAVQHHWGEYQLVWSDEFNGSALDENNWGFNTGGGGWGNQEKQFYTDRTDNVRVEGGNLIIEAKKEDYGGAQYTSGRILSRNKKDFTYGKIEARISLPDGSGLWPAFWMLGYGNWPACGEIDIMEYVGIRPGRVMGTLHTTKDRDGARSNRGLNVENLENNFHVFGVEWAQEEKNGADVIRFYVDGEVYSEQFEQYVDNPDYWPFNKKEYIILNLAVGGTLGGTIKDEIFNNPRQMKVDWVRVYQRNEQ